MAIASGPTNLIPPQQRERQQKKVNWWIVEMTCDNGVKKDESITSGFAMINKSGNKPTYLLDMIPEF